MKYAGNKLTHRQVQMLLARRDAAIEKLKKLPRHKLLAILDIGNSLGLPPMVPLYHEDGRVQIVGGDEQPNN